MVVGSVNGVGGIHAPSKVSELIANPFPEMRPGGSFMNLLLAADWVAGQLAIEGISHAERLELIEAHVALVCQMRHAVAGLSKVNLKITAEWVDRVRSMSSKLGTAEE
jgi:hypothetical protein